MEAEFFLYVQASELKDEMCLGVAADKDSLLARLQTDYVFLDLDASWCAAVKLSQTKRFVAALRHQLRLAPDDDLDLATGWVGTRDQGALVLRAARECRIRTQRAGTVLRARSTPKHQWKLRLEHLKHAKRMRTLRAAAMQTNVYNSACVQACLDLISDLIACADELYLDTDAENDTNSVELYALAQAPASVAALNARLASGNPTGQLAYPNGGFSRFFSGFSHYSDAHRTLFTLTLTSHYRKRTSYLAPDALAGLEEILARLHALPRVPDSVREAHHKADEDFWRRLSGLDPAVPCAPALPLSCQ